MPGGLRRRRQRRTGTGATPRVELRRESKLRHNLPGSTILRDVWNPVACVFAWATVWSVVHRSLTEVARGSGVVGLGLFAGSSTVGGSGEVVREAYEFADGAAFDDG